MTTSFRILPSSLLASLTLSAAALGCTPMHPPAAATCAQHEVAKAPPRSPADARPVYRLDFAISPGDASKVGPGGTYTMNVEEQGNGEIHEGTNIALPTQARMDVGVKLKCSFFMVGNDLLLRSSVEMSSVEDSSTIRKFSGNGEALVTPGKPALVTSIEDSAGHKRFQLAVTATKLR